MDVFEFDKCLLTRLKESRDVLCWANEAVSSARVKYEWKYFVELQIEPTGWQALWRIPRIICEELNIRYPTVVFGMVQNVLFQEMKAIFNVQAVQDDSVHIPEQQEVNLIDLHPTKEQENEHLNIENTANCIDSLRFFYKNVWMPWDNDIDDDFDWAEKHLESRIRFFYDLKKKDMKRSLAAHIRTLLMEARYIQERREYIEISVDSEKDKLEESIHKSEITDLMRLHLRLSMIKNEIEILENPELRLIYEESKHDNDVINTDTNIYIVTGNKTIIDQLEYLKRVKKYIEDEKSFTQICPSLKSALDLSNPRDEIFLPPGKHSVKFLDCLNENGTITGVRSNNLEEEVTLNSADDECILLVFEGNFKLKNVTLDCRNITTGILVKQGNILLDSCVIIGNGLSSTQHGIVCSGDSKLLLKNSRIENFATGIILNDKSELMLKNSSIKNCIVGLEPNDMSKIAFESSYIEKSNQCGIFWETSYFIDKESKTCKVGTIAELKEKVRDDIAWCGDCDFKDCENGNIVIANKSESYISKVLSVNSSLDEDFHSLDDGNVGSVVKRFPNVDDSGNEEDHIMRETSVYIIEDSFVDNSL